MTREESWILHSKLWIPDSRYYIPDYSVADPGEGLARDALLMVANIFIYASLFGGNITGRRQIFG